MPQKIFKALFSLINPIETKIVSFGTTGSGRKLVGEIFGADAIVNEITAHGRGAASFFLKLKRFSRSGVRMQNISG